jgi:Tfp pilus assembly protein PilV
MNKNQQGFGALEGLIVVILILVAGSIGFYIAHNNKDQSSSNSSSSSTNQKVLLAELKSTKSTGYDWDFIMYKDGSGTATYQNTPRNTRPLPKDETFASNSFDTSSFQEQLDTLNPATYSVDTSNPTCSPDDYEIIYNGHIFNNIQCYIGFTQNHASALGSQLSKIFNVATNL